MGNVNTESQTDRLKLISIFVYFYCSLCCYQLFSQSCSAGLMFLVDAGQLPHDAVTTAWFLKTINDWFDIMSSRHGKMALYRGSLQKLHKLYEVMR